MRESLWRAIGWSIPIDGHTFRHMLLKLARLRGVQLQCVPNRAAFFLTTHAIRSQFCTYSTGRHTVAYGLWGSKSKIPTQVYGNYDADDVDAANRQIHGLPPRVPSEMSSPVLAPYYLMRTPSWDKALRSVGFERHSEAAKINLYCALNIEPAALVEVNGSPRDRRLLMREILRARLALESRQKSPLMGASSFVQGLGAHAPGLAAASAAAVAAAAVMPPTSDSSGVLLAPLYDILRLRAPGLPAGLGAFSKAALAASPLVAAAAGGVAATAATAYLGAFFRVSRDYSLRIATIVPLAVVAADATVFARGLPLILFWLLATVLLLLLPRALVSLKHFFFYRAFPPLPLSFFRAQVAPRWAATRTRRCCTTST